MYGVVGYLDRAGEGYAPIGRIALRMLRSLSPHAPDSTGAAFFMPEVRGQVLVVVKIEGDDVRTLGGRVVRRVGRKANVVKSRMVGHTLSLVLNTVEDVYGVVDVVESVSEIGGVECFSVGRRLSIFKDVGSIDHLEEQYALSTIRGTHMIGQARLATESRVDMSHSQPFWARPRPDVAVAHAGQITNYHKLRRKYESHGQRFFTTNDAELIGTFLAMEMEQGASLEDAMRASLDALDGTYAYVVATEKELGAAKDFMGARPLVIAETDEFVVVSSEAAAVCEGLEQDLVTWEPDAKEVHVWTIRSPLTVDHSEQTTLP
ncbi:MAG: hypothetical protein OXE05_03630 [Chloroflexi bacterium]|nr:hypothetical protein [Chloroflexota bacterium]